MFDIAVSPACPGPDAERHLPARHLYVIGHFTTWWRPNALRPLRRGVLLVPESTGRQLTRSWASAFLAQLRRHQLRLHAECSSRAWQGCRGASTTRPYTRTGRGWQALNVLTPGAPGAGLAQLFFIVNFFLSLKKGARVAENPWNATTLEWAAPSPPGHGNFIPSRSVYREPTSTAYRASPTLLAAVPGGGLT